MSAAGFIRLATASRENGIDRHLLTAAYEAGHIEGKREGRALWLLESSLATWISSRPRCVADGCDRQVFGAGPGCSHHRRHSSATRERQRAAARKRSPRVELTCQHCGAPFWRTPYEVQRDNPRFCSKRCGGLSRTYSERAIEALRDAGRRRLAKVEAARSSGRLLLRELEELMQTKASGFRRSRHVLADHADRGLLPAESVGGVRLVDPGSIDQYLTALERYPDGRLTRFNATDPDRARWRTRFIRKRHGEKAYQRAAGRLAAVISKAGPKIKLAAEEDIEIRRRRDQGQSQDQIAAKRPRRETNERR